VRNLRNGKSSSSAEAAWTCANRCSRELCSDGDIADEVITRHRVRPMVTRPHAGSEGS